MRQLDQIAEALIGALGFSTRRSVARMKVLCRGADTAASETVLILEVRIRTRTAPLANPDTTRRPAGSGSVKQAANKMRPKTSSSTRTPNRSLKQYINQRASEQTSSSQQSGDRQQSLGARLPGQLQSGVFTAE